MSVASFESTRFAGGQRYLDVADGIGCALVREAIWQGDRCNWLCWNLEPGAGGAFVPVLKPATPELYSGVSGIALFLARLQAATGDPHQRRAARGALRQALAATAEWWPTGSGFYAGPVGVGWSLIHIGRSLDDEVAIGRGLALLERAAREPVAPGFFDLLNGRAGAALGLVAAARAFGRGDLLAGAVRLAEELVAAARIADGAMSWPSGLEGRDLLGLSHGTAGAALALHEVAAAAGRSDFRDAARACLRYERVHFDRWKGGWPDFRILAGQSAGEPTYPFVWCHGGVGIGLSRLRIRELDPGDAETAAEIDAVTAAVTARLARGVSAEEDFSLCHGVAGIGEFLVELAVRVGRPEALEAARRIGDVGAAGCHDTGSPWRCGVPQAGETPSTMTGTTSIGLHYLRLFDPACAPSLALPTGDSLDVAQPHRVAA
ncbi:lanthionine synthetase LanC family protein [Lichenibacterium dinghuense]|uniref:lanthionine synthetase LanC family protein n=1 Tax=Lichenibacterium dinghuense TaxID=2895977 RepID=UPI001F33EEA3|nr:lanthionine synthetase LanC family protein [Lichenibacterium sp. 6Y81]